VAAEPELSVVIPAEDWAAIARPLGRLAAQEGAEGIELLLVSPRAGELGPPPAEAARLWGARAVVASNLDSLERARLAGIHEARAALVAFGETHSYQEQGWARALVEAHREPWGAVGPSVTNANPGSAISWANLFLDYGDWLELDEGREADQLPGHNSCYKRELLLGHGAELERLLEAELMLQEDLRRRGHRLWLEPRARLAHLNVSRSSQWMSERFWTGRFFAAARSHGWSLGKRFLYVAGSPLIPLVRARRLAPVRRRCARRRLLPRFFGLALALALVISAVGELVGYLVGPGGSKAELTRIELYRERYVTDADRAELPPAAS
jgi:hypothetical protein